MFQSKTYANFKLVQFIN